jgi:holo-[acyl-carrier protein] synthase
MIVGIGTDLLSIHRLESTYNRTKGQLAQRILGYEELQVFLRRVQQNRKRGISYLATRFAVKEAFSKAIGLGMCSPMTWRSLQTLNANNGKPFTSYSGALADLMTGKKWRAHVSVTDEYDMVMAYVVIEQDHNND